MADYAFRRMPSRLDLRALLPCGDFCGHEVVVHVAVVRIVEIVVEFVQHFRAWRRREQRDHHDEQQRDDERRQQLVDGEDATERLDEVVPDEHGGRAGQHARDRAVLVGAPPVQRGEHQRSEGCAEAGPRVRDHLEDRGVLVERHHDAEDEHDEQRDARHHHHLAVGGLAVQQSAEDVLADGRGADDHVRGRGAHGRGEDAGHDDAAHEARQQRLRHNRGFHHRVGQHKVCAGGQPPQGAGSNAVRAGDHSGSGIQKQRQRAFV